MSARSIIREHVMSQLDEDSHTARVDELVRRMVICEKNSGSVLLIGMWGKYLHELCFAGAEAVGRE